MKNSHLSIEEIDLKIGKTTEKLLRLNASSVNSEHRPSRYNTLPSDSQGRPAVGISLRSKRYRQLLKYLIIFHYYPLEESVWCYLFLDLQNHIENVYDSHWLSVLLENKTNFLKWLEVQETITPEAFFSSICSVKDLDTAMSEISFNFEEHLRRPTRKIRRKGYNDKGSLPNSNKKAIKYEESIDIFLFLEQLSYELKMENHQKERILLRNFLVEGSSLSRDLLIQFKILKG